jgi:hypothetical protein
LTIDDCAFGPLWRSFAAPQRAKKIVEIQLVVQFHDVGFQHIALIRGAQTLTQIANRKS